MNDDFFSICMLGVILGAVAAVLVAVPLAEQTQDHAHDVYLCLGISGNLFISNSDETESDGRIICDNTSI